MSPTMVITDPKGDVRAIEIQTGAVLIVHRGTDCLYVSEGVPPVGGKVQGITREICSVPREIRIKVLP